MKMKINKNLIPMKAHFFFFNGAAAPIGPFISVYGKALGISEVVMGSIGGVMPILLFVIKPSFGCLIDVFHEYRKLLFIVLLICRGLFYSSFYFIQPMNYTSQMISVPFESFCNDSISCTDSAVNDFKSCPGGAKQKGNCTVICSDEKSPISNISVFMTDQLNVTQLNCVQSKYINNVTMDKDANNIAYSSYFHMCDELSTKNCTVSCSTIIDEGCIHYTFTFWKFVFLNYAATIAGNTLGGLTDVICFDLLGSGNENIYGIQRLWAAMGHSIFVLASGYTMDSFSDHESKNYNPAFIMVMVLTSLNLLCCVKLKVPVIKKSENILKDLRKVIKIRGTLVFFFFAIFAGMFDCLIVFYLFWYMEDLAAGMGVMANVKLLEGLTIALAQIGDVVFFCFSPKILEYIGYGHAFSLGFFVYVIRFGMLSFVNNPLYIPFCEMFLEGPSFGLLYISIVAYARAISPPGVAGVMQGLATGMGDGIGWSIGAFGGGIIYKAATDHNISVFTVFSMIAFICSISHFLTFKFYVSKHVENKAKDEDDEYNPQPEAIELTQDSPALNSS